MQHVVELALDVLEEAKDQQEAIGGGSWLTVSNSERKHEAPATTSGWGLSPPPVRILSGRVAGGVISPKS